MKNMKTMKKTEESALKLKVTEALSKDVGRAYARMGPEDLEKLQVAIGDIVEVVGKRTTVCKAMPAYKELRGRSRMQLDGISRENAGAGIDDFVQVKKIACRPAERVVLTPITITPAERDLKYIGSLLDGLPVLEGDRIRATLFGSRTADFKVGALTPRGPVLINPTTTLVIGKAGAPETRKPAVSYEDVGCRPIQFSSCVSSSFTKQLINDIIYIIISLRVTPGIISQRLKILFKQFQKVICLAHILSFSLKTLWFEKKEWEVRDANRPTRH